jgi:PAS domain S-box-containing protein
VATQYAVTQILAASPTLNWASRELLRAIGEDTGWEVGVLWTVDHRAGVLRCTSVWEQHPGLAADFAAELRAVTLASGVGLPGQVWATSQPAWVADVAQASDCPVAPLALRSGLRGVFAFPLRAGNEIEGVMVFLSPQIREPGQDLLHMLTALGRQVGQFMARKRAEEQLREQEERFRQLAGTITEVFWMSNRDLTEILYVSPAYETVWGRSCQSLYERPLSFLEAVHPDDRAHVTALIMERQKGQGRGFAHEYRIVRPDGSIRWIWDRGFPIQNEAGEACRFAGIAEDITERKQMEEDLRQRTEQVNVINDSLMRLVQSDNWKEASESLLRTALRQTGSEYGFIGVVVEGPVLRILAHAGIVWDQAENREFYEQALRTYREKGYLEFTNFGNLFGRAITGKQVVIANEPATDPRAGGLPPGHPPLRHFLGVPILQGPEVIGMIGLANRPGGYMGTELEQVEILTEAVLVLSDRYRRHLHEQRLEQQLRQAEKMAAMGTLIAGVSHEFNNPLFAVSGHVEMAREKIQEGDYTGLAEDLVAIGEATDRVSGIVQRFLDVARSSTGHREPCSVNELLERALDLAANDLFIHNVSVRQNFSAHLPPVMAEPGELLQVFLNLFTNARQAMVAAHGKGTLTVSTALVADTAKGKKGGQGRGGQWVEVRIEDDGLGVAPEHLARIFEPFFTTKPVGEGTGLGLSLCHRIVTGIGGSITCHSEKGRGATFIMKFPSARADETRGQGELDGE